MIPEKLRSFMIWNGFGTIKNFLMISTGEISPIVPYSGVFKKKRFGCV